VFPTLRAEILPNGKIREYYDYERYVVACPWHGWEYDLETGVCLADPSRRIAVYSADQDGPNVVVTMPD
jgi:nitrite reductase/ring-hydroxylating ferredoxin subunit